tara:strand:- start:17 stop:2101 length:2085 start_codon:yes stop_codon:yes gene_type:complete
MTSSFQGYAPSTEFDPVEPVDMVDSLEEQQNKFLRSIRDRNRQMYEYEMQAAKQKDQRLQRLAGLSQGIARMLEPQIEKRKKRQEAIGQAKFYNLGIDEQNNIIEKNHIEAKVENTFEGTNTNLVEEGRKSGSLSYLSGNIVKNLGKNQQRGFYKAYLSSKSSQYPMFVRQLRNYKFPVVINGETVEKSWHELEMTDIANKTIIDNRIREIFLSDVTDPDIQELAVEYLYQPMQKYETQLARDDANNYQTQIEANEKAEKQEELITTIENEHAFDFAESIRKRGLEIGSQATAKLEVVNSIKELLDNGDIDPSNIIGMMNQEITLDNGTTMTLFTYLGNSGNRLQRYLDDARKTKIEKEEEWGRLQGIEYIEKVEKLFEDLDNPPTEADLQAAKDGWNLDWGPMPNKLLGILTAEDKDDEDTIKFIDYLFKTNQRVPLNLVNRINDPNTFTQYKGLIKSHNAEQPGGNLSTQRDNSIRAIVRSKTGLELADESSGSIQFIRYFKEGQTAYKEVFAQELKRTGNENTAHEAAMNAVETKLGVDVIDKDGNVIIDVETFQDRFSEREKMLNTYDKKLTGALQKLASVNGDFTQDYITGTSSDLHRIHEMNSKGIDVEIPPIFHKLAEAYKNYTAVDIINAQLRLRGLPPIKREEKGISDPRILRLREYKSTPRRLIRSENMSKNYNTKDGMLLAGI